MRLILVGLAILLAIGASIFYSVGFGGTSAVPVWMGFASGAAGHFAPYLIDRISKRSGRLILWILPSSLVLTALVVAFNRANYQGDSFFSEIFPVSSLAWTLFFLTVSVSIVSVLLGLTSGSKTDKS